MNAGKPDQLKRYMLLVDTLNKKWSENPRLPELKNQVTFIQKNWK